MDQPTNLIPLVDADILRYEIGYAAETGWRSITEDTEAIPPFSYVETLLIARLANICAMVGTTATPRLFLTEGRTFRYDIAVTKPYKGTRVAKKPWHYANLTVYMRDVLGATIVTGIEADDRLSIEQAASNGTTIICSRDKDLRQCPGYFYSWELGRQPSFGPVLIDKMGTIELSADHKKINATGLYAFYAQVLTGDKVDNIPGLPGCGPVAAYDILVRPDDYNSIGDRVIEAYIDHYNRDVHINWIEALEEQSRLCWMTRRLHNDGTPVLWELSVEE